MKMYLTELVKMEEKELNKTPKVEMIKAITGYRYQWTHLEGKVKDLEAQLSQQSENERAVKMLLIGYLGKEVERNDYSGDIDLSKINLSELVGELMVKAARY